VERAAKSGEPTNGTNTTNTGRTHGLVHREIASRSRIRAIYVIRGSVCWHFSVLYFSVGSSFFAGMAPWREALHCELPFRVLCALSRLNPGEGKR
jgi:hypothetical protein